MFLDTTEKINFMPTQITLNNIIVSDVREHVCVCVVWTGIKSSKVSGRIVAYYYFRKYIIPEVPI